MKKIILKPIAFSIILAGFLSSFGGCTDDKITSSESHNANFTFNCIDNEMMLKSEFSKEIPGDQKNSTYIFTNTETNTRLTFTYTKGELNRFSQVAITKRGSLLSYQISDKINLTNGEAKYILKNISNTNGERLEVTDCALAYELGDQLGIEVIK